MIIEFVDGKNMEDYIKYNGKGLMINEVKKFGS